MPRRLRVSRLQALQMEASSGAFSWAGRNAEFTYARHLQMQANRGIFQWSGFNSNLSKQRYLMQATRGQFAMSGFTAELTYTGSLPTWSSTVPAKSFTFGTPETWSLVPYTTGFNSLLHRFELLSGTLPSGVTVVPTTGLSYNGAGTAGTSASTSYRIADIASGVQADWTARSTAAGVFFKENFNYASLAAASNNTTNPKFYGASPGTGANSPSPTIFEIRDDNKLSGRALRINFPANSGQDSRTWLYTFDNNLGAQVPFNGSPAGGRTFFYFQCIVKGTHFNFPYRDSQGMATPKVFNIDRHDSSTNEGEVVIINPFGQGKVGAYRLGSSLPDGPFALIGRSRSTPQNGSDIQYQNAVDTGTPASPTTMTQYRQRYGHFFSDNVSIASGSINGTSTWSGVGVPRSDEGGVNWIQADGSPTVVTVLIDKPNDRIRIWASKYGSAPVLQHDTALDNRNNNLGGISGRNASNAFGSGGGGGGWPGFQLTLFLTDNQNAGGSAQPTMYCDYLEVIASTNPINHPGGFALPGV